jgi:hypothetical protein
MKLILFEIGRQVERKKLHMGGPILPKVLSRKISAILGTFGDMRIEIKFLFKNIKIDITS